MEPADGVPLIRTTAFDGLLVGGGRGCWIGCGKKKWLIR